MGTMDHMIIVEARRRAMAQAQRTAALQSYAYGLSRSALEGGLSDGESFARIVDYAGLLVSHLGPLPSAPEDMAAYVMLEDLRRVLIGDGFSRSHRNHGEFALRFGAFGDSGFRPDFQDGGNQVQHAMAGIYFGYHYGAGAARRLMTWQDDGEADRRLYDATFPIGAAITDANFRNLAGTIRRLLLA